MPYISETSSALDASSDRVQQTTIRVYEFERAATTVHATKVLRSKTVVHHIQYTSAGHHVSVAVFDSLEFHPKHPNPHPSGPSETTIAHGREARLSTGALMQAVEEDARAKHKAQAYVIWLPAALYQDTCKRYGDEFLASPFHLGTVSPHRANPEPMETHWTSSFVDEYRHLGPQADGYYFL